MNAEGMWCVIVNRITCSSRWKKWQVFLEAQGISYMMHHTQTVAEAEMALTSDYSNGHRKYLFVGGDGTIHYGGNVLMELAGNASREITIGVLPCGTGNDWVRTYGTMKDKLAIALREEYTAPLNLIRLSWPDGHIRYAFNMVGGALDAAVVSDLRRASVKIPSYILYPFGLLKALLKPHIWRGTINTDGDMYSGEIMTIQAGFGKYCGGGMYMLPQAREDSPGLLIMKPKSLVSILWSIPKVYNGKIIYQPEAMAGHFEEIEIKHSENPIPFEADGEFLGYSPVKLKVCYDVMKRIV